MSDWADQFFDLPAGTGNAMDYSAVEEAQAGTNSPQQQQEQQQQMPENNSSIAEFGSQQQQQQPAQEAPMTPCTALLHFLPPSINEDAPEFTASEQPEGSSGFAESSNQADQRPPPQQIQQQQQEAAGTTAAQRPQAQPQAQQPANNNRNNLQSFSRAQLAQGNGDSGAFVHAQSFGGGDAGIASNGSAKLSAKVQGKQPVRGVQNVNANHAAFTGAHGAQQGVGQNALGFGVLNNGTLQQNVFANGAANPGQAMAGFDFNPMSPALMSPNNFAQFQMNQNLVANNGFGLNMNNVQNQGMNNHQFQDMNNLRTNNHNYGLNNYGQGMNNNILGQGININHNQGVNNGQNQGLNNHNPGFNNDQNQGLNNFVSQGFNNGYNQSFNYAQNQGSNNHNQRVNSQPQVVRTASASPLPAAQNENGYIRRASNGNLNNWFRANQLQQNEMENMNSQFNAGSFAPNPNFNQQQPRMPAGQWPPAPNDHAPEPHRRAQVHQGQRNSVNPNAAPGVQKHAAGAQNRAVAGRVPNGQPAADPQALSQEDAMKAAQERREMAEALHAQASRAPKSAITLSPEQRLVVVDKGLRDAFTQGFKAALAMAKTGLVNEVAAQQSLFGIQLAIPNGIDPVQCLRERATHRWDQLANGEGREQRAGATAQRLMREQQTRFPGLYPQINGGRGVRAAAPIATPLITPSPERVDEGGKGPKTKATKAPKKRGTKDSYTLTGKNKTLVYNDGNSRIQGISFGCSDGHDRILDGKKLQAARDRTAKENPEAARIAAPATQETHNGVSRDELQNTSSNVGAVAAVDNTQASNPQANNNAVTSSNNVAGTQPAKRKQPPQKLQARTAKAQKQNSTSEAPSACPAVVQPQTQPPAQTGGLVLPNVAPTVHRANSPVVSNTEPTNQVQTQPHTGGLVLPNVAPTIHTTASPVVPDIEPTAQPQEQQQAGGLVLPNVAPTIHKPSSPVARDAEPAVQTQADGDMNQAPVASEDDLFGEDEPMANRTVIDLSDDADADGGAVENYDQDAEGEDVEAVGNGAEKPEAPADPDADRIKWFTKQKKYEALPTTVIKNFMHPSIDSIHGAVQKAAEAGRTEDMSHLLENQRHCRIALIEYDDWSNKRLGIGPGDRAPDENERKAEKRQRKKERKMREYGSANQTTSEGAADDSCDDFDSADTMDVDDNAIAEARQARFESERQNAEDAADAELVADLEAAFEGTSEPDLETEPPGSPEGQFETLLADREAATQVGNVLNPDLACDSDGEISEED